ncbi:MAG: VOC family protein [Oscillospiraceae bacterium]
MAVIPYISFKNSTKEALDFYVKALDGENVIVTTYGDMPSDPQYPLSDEDKKLVANAMFNTVGGSIMISDMPDSMMDGFIEGNNISIALIYNDKELIKKHFANMSEGGIIYMPLDKAPWTELFGTLEDKFGISWQFSYNTEEYYK